MARQIIAFDWAAHPLGPIDTWPKTLLITAGMMLRSPFPKAIVWGENMTTLYNDAFRPILGAKENTLGASFSDVWAEAWDDLGEIADRAYAGEGTFVEDFPMVINRFGYEEQAYFTFSYSPIHDEQGDVLGFMNTVIETTGKIEANRRSAIVNTELAHRIKNTLTIVQSIASQTLRTAPDMPTARRLLSQRLQTLAQTHSLLTGGSKGDAPVRDVVESALALHIGDGSRVTLSGPALHLGERQALSLGMAVNELATNALKYGALSVETGKVRIEWTTGETFQFHWLEQGGPIISPPKRIGFGSRLLKDVVSYDFKGVVTLEFASTGLCYKLNCDPRNLRPEMASQPGETQLKP
ncbi:sensor histidine kinase [Limoniibacter endophyticus]|nr:PAS domain-containing sensor histidine kinase [Limoniibacter endophyticus]